MGSRSACKILGVAVIAAIATMAANAATCLADVKVQMIVIGNNQDFNNEQPASADPPRPPLQFADDDAAAFYSLIAGIADDGHLLTTMDRATQLIYPALTSSARSPTLRELRSAVSAVARQIEKNVQEGHRNVVFVFFSGHGSLAYGGEPGLALLDGGITNGILYEEILAKLPADYIHVVIDACHAEAVVRPRDEEAEVVKVTRLQATSFRFQSTLARFPHVGAIVAATSNAQAHEWDLLRHGVFTYELLSALRGAADVNHDQKIEYSEVYAFLAAANRGIEDPRGRLSIVARPPDVDRGIAILDLSRFPMSHIARLTGLPPRAGIIQVEDGAGRPIATFHGAAGFLADLMVPASATIYLRTDSEEARIETVPGEIIPFARIRFSPLKGRPRGALEDAMRRGLFASAFGRAYYDGFIDQAVDFVPVSSSPSFIQTVSSAPLPADGGIEDQKIAVPSSSSGAIVGAGVSNTVMRTGGVSQAVRLGFRPPASRGGFLSVDLFRAAEHGATEWQLATSVGWSWAAKLGPARGWLGAACGGGVILQTADGETSRWSGMVMVGPALGLTMNLSRRVGIWSEAQLFGRAYRLEGQNVFSTAPSAWIGTSFGL